MSARAPSATGAVGARRGPGGRLAAGVVVAGLLPGCTSMPSEIPNSPGVIDADIATELYSIASPDLPYLLYQTMLQVQTEDFRTCPAYEGEGTNFTLIGDCSDSAGVSWNGTGSVSGDSITEAVSFDKFGASGIEGGWEASGTELVELARGSTSVFITSQVKLVQLDDPEKVYWIDTVGSYTADLTTGVQYSDQYDGTVGIEDWGTATVSARRTALAFINECDYAEAGFGSSDLLGSNGLNLDFHPVTDAGTDTGDTGLDTATDSGDSGDTGDTGDSATPPPGDTGQDTGDTGDTADTGGDSSPDSGDTATDSADTGGSDTGTTSIEACGCATVAIDGVTGDTCAVPTRAFAWPFLALGE